MTTDSEAGLSPETIESARQGCYSDAQLEALSNPEQSAIRRFKRGQITIECEPGRDIVILKGGNRITLDLGESHFVLTRLQEAMRIALRVQELDLRGEQ